jgi:hypothetical protein
MFSSSNFRRDVQLREHSGIAVDHYRMTGDQERELWYDEHGRLVRVKFQSGRSDIEFILQDSSTGPGAFKVPASDHYILTIDRFATSPLSPMPSPITPAMETPPEPDQHFVTQKPPLVRHDPVRYFHPLVIGS